MKKSKIVYMGNNFVGWQVLKWLKEQEESIELLIVHDQDKAKFKKEIIEVSGLNKKDIFDASKIHTDRIKNKIKEKRPDFILSVMFDYILKKDILEIPRYGCINLHNGLLPYNAGNYANVWSIIDKTPAGTTLHFIDEGIDTGPIINQKEVPISFADTGETLFHKIELACIELFKKSWPKIKTHKLKAKFQSSKKRTYHKKNDVNKIDHINLEKKYKAGDLINVLKARTFPPYEGAYAIVNGKKYFIRISIQEADS